MNTAPAPLALIAEDEPVLARNLSRLLREAWPEMRLSSIAEDGISACNLALAQLPDILFLDIQMPGRTGLEVAEIVTDD